MSEEKKQKSDEIKEFGSVEADYFLENCFNSFFLSLEELKK